MGTLAIVIGRSFDGLLTMASFGRKIVLDVIINSGTHLSLSHKDNIFAFCPIVILLESLVARPSGPVPVVKGILLLRTSQV